MQLDDQETKEKDMFDIVHLIILGYMVSRRFVSPLFG